MIKHHPTFELLAQHVNAELPASLSAGIRIHCEMCAECRALLEQLTELVAKSSFESKEAASLESKPNIEFDDMIAAITASNDIAQVTELKNTELKIKGQTYNLPPVLKNMPPGKQSQFGKLTRTRLALNEGEIHSNLIHIEPGGSIPEHSHKGFELTVLLEGSFKDEQSEYHPGDFIMLDARHQHHPVSEHGCLCYTVANGALHFTKGINKLLNPIGAFIY